MSTHGAAFMAPPLQWKSKGALGAWSYSKMNRLAGLQPEPVLEPCQTSPKKVVRDYDPCDLFTIQLVVYIFFT